MQHKRHVGERGVDTGESESTDAVAQDCCLPAHLKPLLEARTWPHDVEEIVAFQTHISFIVLTGPYAYKIKRPVDLGFVNYSTLERRKHFCEEEIRLNRQYTKDLYCDVVSICADPHGLSINGEGEVIEYAVRMKQFPGGAHVIDKDGSLTCDATQFRVFGLSLSGKHENAPHGPGQFARATAQFKLLHDAVQGVVATTTDPLFKSLARFVCEQLCKRQYETSVYMQRRIDSKRIRQCHGDLHLGNVIYLNGHIQAFDALEFNRTLQVTDVAADVAFLCMDLEAQGYWEQSNAFLSGWLEGSGDYDALYVLDFYRAYRALVRARVEAIALRNVSGKDTSKAGYHRVAMYLALARRIATQPRQPCLYITRGVSGTGKSTICAALESQLPAIWIRSDLERKRNPSVLDYSAAGRHRIYQSLVEAGGAVLASGRSVILDATFLNPQHCELARQVAHELALPFVILDLTASRDTLVRRVAARQKKGADPSDATVQVLDNQLASYLPLGPDFDPHVFTVDTTDAVNTSALARALPWLARLPVHGQVPGPPAATSLPLPRAARGGGT